MFFLNFWPEPACPAPPLTKQRSAKCTWQFTQSEGQASPLSNLTNHQKDGRRKNTNHQKEGRRKNTNHKKEGGRKEDHHNHHQLEKCFSHSHTHCHHQSCWNGDYERCSANLRKDMGIAVVLFVFKKYSSNPPKMPSHILTPTALLGCLSCNLSFGAISKGCGDQREKF